MRIISVYIPSLITLLVSPLCAAEASQLSDTPYLHDSTFASLKFSIVGQPFPEALKPFVTNETPGMHENITLTLSQEQYEQFKHLIDPLTHISIILCLEEGSTSSTQKDAKVP